MASQALFAQVEHAISLWPTMVQKQHDGYYQFIEVFGDAEESVRLSPVDQDVLIERGLGDKVLWCTRTSDTPRDILKNIFYHQGRRYSVEPLHLTSVRAVVDGLPE